MKKLTLLLMGLVFVAGTSYAGLFSPDNNDIGTMDVSPYQLKPIEYIPTYTSELTPEVASNFLASLAEDLENSLKKGGYTTLELQLAIKLLNNAANAIAEAENPVVEVGFKVGKGGEIKINIKAAETPTGLSENIPFEIYNNDSGVFVDLDVQLKVTDKTVVEEILAIVKDDLAAGNERGKIKLLNPEISPEAAERIIDTLVNNLDEVSVVDVSSELVFTKPIDKKEEIREIIR